MKYLCTITILFFIYCQSTPKDYVCTPCDLPCDQLTFSKPGICPHCKMALVHKEELLDESTLLVNQVDLKNNSGVFLVAGTKGRTVKVYYHKPRGFNKDSKILMVIPGAGRNGDSYRNAWQVISEQYNVLILAPMFKEKDYPFEDYHLGGLFTSTNLQESINFLPNSNMATLDEDKSDFQYNNQKEDWLFNSFDHIFNLVKTATGSAQNKYDLFGHSAGAQILHRLVLFSPSASANKILAANAGFYTLPDSNTAIPFGLQKTDINNLNLTQSYAKQLTVLVGALDNADEKKGTLLRSKTVDLQGLHRLDRAQYFYNFSKQSAAALSSPFNWQLKVIPNVGHDHELMASQAAALLYK